MSTVLWANVLVDGEVRSDQSDHPCLCRHTKKLDVLCREIGLPSFAGICDTTDQRFNLGDDPLPAGMTSTDKLMAAEGVWMSAGQALGMLERLREHIVDRKVRFGLLGDQRDAVVAEKDEVIGFVREQATDATRFNFAVVM